jgi:hypothetical protein
MSEEQTFFGVSLSDYTSSGEGVGVIRGWIWWNGNTLFMIGMT